MALPTPGWNVVFGEIPAASKWTQLGQNDDALQNWSAFTAASFPVSLLAANIIQAGKIDWTTAGQIWWQELGRGTLAAAGNTLTVNFTAKKYLMAKFYAPAGGTGNELCIRLNGDAGANYSLRRTANGGADSTAINTTVIDMMGGNNTVDHFGWIELENIAAYEKFVRFWLQDSAAGAGQIPERFEGLGKWANTSSQVNSISLLNIAGGNMQIGTELVILGHD